MYTVLVKKKNCKSVVFIKLYLTVKVKGFNHLVNNQFLQYMVPNPNLDIERDLKF